MWTGLWAGLHGLRRARHSELARLRAEAERSALERDALRARLNPHFMFNALNNLRALILEDPERARDMVTRLSRTLRQALAHNRSEQVTLAEELAVVDDYLAIEAIHFEQRLQVARRIDADALQAQLPAMALQLLVENAIKHGIASRPGGGGIEIRATLDNDVLRLQVDNPLGNASEPTHGHGVGLAYLRAQLGSRGRFTLQPVGDRMQALLEIPQ
ncbi:MAG: histidine kinase [Stenotrophomonas geniculata]